MNGLLPKTSDGCQISMSHIDKLYVFAIMWSCGATLELDDREKLEEFMRTNLDLDLPMFDPSSNHTIFEYFVDQEGNF